MLSQHLANNAGRGGGGGSMSECIGLLSLSESLEESERCATIPLMPTENEVSNQCKWGRRAASATRPY